MQLRPYQNQAVDAVLGAFQAGVRRPLYVLPTGCGKTQVFVGIRQRLGGKALILAHREELLDQAANRFLSVDPQSYPQIEQGSRKAARWAQVVAASVQTLVRGSRLDWFQPELIVVDEAHHAVSPTHRKVLERFGVFEEGGPYLVGCTATPKRLDAKSLGAVFQEQVYTYSIRDAIRDGFLCDIRGYQVKSNVDLSKVKTTAGDYNQRALADAVDVESRTAAAVKHWLEVASDRPTIAFCVTVEHARHAAEAWRNVGVPAEHIDGSMGTEQRRGILARFKSGELQVLTNVDICTEGWDHPPLSCVVMLRPTQSWAFFVQAVGRGTRIYPGKPDCLVLDVADNCGKHSLASVPAILDLPAGLDLQGHTISEAATKLQELGERAAALESYQPAMFSELDTMLEKVDLLLDVEPPAEVKQAGCRLSWLRGGEGYRVSCGSRRMGDQFGPRREAVLAQDLLGHWMLTLYEGGLVVRQGPTPLAADAETTDVLSLTDRAVRSVWPDVELIAGQDAAWKRKPATDAQKLALRKRGVPTPLLETLDRGTASAMLDRVMAARGRGRAA